MLPARESSVPLPLGPLAAELLASVRVLGLGLQSTPPS